MKKILLFICVLTAMVVGGCTQDDSLVNPQDNGEYLSLPANTDFNALQDSDWDVIWAALDRINLKEAKDGKLILTPKNAAAANMSENLYEYINVVVTNYNDNLMVGPISSRSDYESNVEGDYAGPTDCFARAIAGAMWEYSYEYANRIITDTFGTNGVLLSDAERCMALFGHAERLSPEGHNGEYLQRCIVIIPGEGHVVTGYKIIGDAVWCIDYQDQALHGGNGWFVRPLSEAVIYKFK